MIQESYFGFISDFTSTCSRVSSSIKCPRWTTRCTSNSARRLRNPSKAGFQDFDSIVNFYFATVKFKVRAKCYWESCLDPQSHFPRFSINSAFSLKLTVRSCKTFKKATEIKSYLHAWCTKRGEKPEYTYAANGKPPRVVNQNYAYSCFMFSSHRAQLWLLLLSSTSSFVITTPLIV